MSHRLSPSWIFLIACLIGAGRAMAQSSQTCLPDYTALQTLEFVDAAHSQNLVHHLSLRVADKTVLTKVQWRAVSDEQDGHILRTSVRFDPEFDGVSLPYNLYSILILLDGEIVVWNDFTAGCQGPGVSFFPGREIRLPSIKLFGEKPQKLQVMIWGRF